MAKPYLTAKRWPTYQVPAREDDRAAGLYYSDARADEVTDEEFATLTPEQQCAVLRDLDEMDCDPDLFGYDVPWAWRDHEHARDTCRPMAAE